MSEHATPRQPCQFYTVRAAYSIRLYSHIHLLNTYAFIGVDRPRATYGGMSWLRGLSAVPRAGRKRVLAYFPGPHHPDKPVPRLPCPMGLDNVEHSGTNRKRGRFINPAGALLQCMVPTLFGLPLFSSGFGRTNAISPKFGSTLSNATSLKNL